MLASGHWCDQWCTGSLPLASLYARVDAEGAFNGSFSLFYHCNSKGIGLLGNLWQLLTHAAGLFVKGGRVMGREVGFQSVGFRTDAPIQTHS